ncbi:MAG: TonB-dependent receptor [Planctomycetes bacterium]|nr:TonB-dependent receptor [Planctomycetota bacterium]
MTRIFFVAALMSSTAITSIAQAQDTLRAGADQDPESRVVELPETVVTGRGGFEEDRFYAPSSIRVISGARLSVSSRTMSEALIGMPSVHVQKTAYGQSSPYIRGLTGYHNVLLVDGVRLNHSAMRAGPNQYWSTVDMYATDQLELLAGTQGVIYGSQAVGGVVQAVSADPRFSTSGETIANGQVYTRWSSAESSFTGRLSGEFATDNWNLQVGQTLANYGDVRGGNEVGTQDETGYDFAGTDLKLTRRVGDDARITFGYQRVKMDDVPRTHKTIDGIDWNGLSVGSEIYRRHDQTRDFAYLRTEWEGSGGWADAGEVTLSLHRHDETRDRMKGSDGVAAGGEFQGFGVNDLGLTARFEADGIWGDRWAYGFEIHREGVDSFKRNFDANRVFTGTEIQGPVAADATYTTIAAYMQDELQIDDAWSLIAGLRAERIDVDVDRVEDPVSGDPTALERDYDAVVGSLRALFMPSRDQVWYGGLSQGFRAPSLYDLTSLDETSVVESPDFDLESEHFFQAEIGGRGRYGGWHWEGAAYNTWVSDMIVRNPEAAVGNEVLKENADGWIRGVEVMAGYAWTDEWSTQLSASWMDGETDQRLPQPDAERVRRSITRLMPLQARLVTTYQPNSQGWWAEAYVWAVDNQDDLSLRDERDTSRIPDRDGDGFADGTPGYTIVGLRSGWQVAEQALLTVALENVGDVDYRVHGSGVNGPGLNLILGLDIRF